MTTAISKWTYIFEDIPSTDRRNYSSGLCLRSRRSPKPLFAEMLKQRQKRRNITANESNLGVRDVSADDVLIEYMEKVDLVEREIHNGEDEEVLATMAEIGETLDYIEEQFRADLGNCSPAEIIDAYANEVRQSYYRDLYLICKQQYTRKRNAEAKANATI